MKKKVFILFLLSLTLSASSFGQRIISPDSIENKMQWFGDAKLGIFIHWGIYSVKGVGESWSFHNEQISYPDYMSQLKGFTGSKYNPQFWADLIKSSGARYAVITTKHHDGVALWDTKESKLNVVKKTPFKRDAITPFFNALRKDGIKCGAYFSLIDWSNYNYPAFLKDSSRYVIAKDPTRWKKFQRFYMTQLSEIMEKFHPDLLWFDGDWEHTAKEWDAPKIRKMLLKYNPKLVINGRLMGYGDYETPEQKFPITRPPYKWWELCMTTNDSWGFQPKDTVWKTPYEIITIFVDVVANGGNLLLDIGPRSDGTIPQQQVYLLRELGKWNAKNGEAIFGTIPGLQLGHYYGPTTMSKDSTTLYLFSEGKTNEILLKGIRNSIKEVSVVGFDTPLKYKNLAGLVYINMPTVEEDKYVTVLRVKLKGAVQLSK